MNSPALEIYRISPTTEYLLAEFFRYIKQAGDDRYFHPHPFDDEMATKIAHYSGKDLYYALVDGYKILGYGMLRGWDAGYEIPSLGIVIHSEARGTGLSKLLMHFLHAAAKQRKASHIRLKVYPDNRAALNLYCKLGYVFESEEAGQLVCKVTL